MIKHWVYLCYIQFLELKRCGACFERSQSFIHTFHLQTHFENWSVWLKPALFLSPLSVYTVVSFQRGPCHLNGVLRNLTAHRNINSITTVLSLTHLEASPPHRPHRILGDRCCDASQKAGHSDRCLCIARCALLSSVLPAVRSCYGCYSLSDPLQSSWHKDKLTSTVLVCFCQCVCVCPCLIAERHETKG